MISPLQQPSPFVVVAAGWPSDPVRLRRRDIGLLLSLGWVRAQGSCWSSASSTGLLTVFSPETAKKMRDTVPG